MAADPSTRKVRAPRNRTIELSPSDVQTYDPKVLRCIDTFSTEALRNRVICGDASEWLQNLESNSCDLLFTDPPYNLTKVFGAEAFRQTSLDEYEKWLETWLPNCARILRSTASVYICGDWRSAAAIQRVGSKYFKLRNRITWEREKGRGSRTNWKNASEDIWFFTVSDDYVFNIQDVQVKRKVIAPYTENGKPKDWLRSAEGNFRLTHPSNLWNDITVPFWSMPENTDHPTQKPEKLLAKIILASSNQGDLILDPFLGSGTTAVVAKKLGRNFIGIESDETFCLLAEKRLQLADNDKAIQGYADGVFWERNTLNLQNSKNEQTEDDIVQPSLL
jgi:site-specific DNA-methyltransferase (adenine-specific)